MFKKRLITFLLYLVGIPLFYALMIGVGILIGKFTPILKWMDYLTQHNTVVVGILLGMMMLVMLYSFINWLFIEPIKNHRKHKEIK